MDVNHKTPTPLSVPRSRRGHALAVLTSLPAGKGVPVAAIPMLREDKLNASVRIAVEMLETKEILMNPVALRVTAYCVPWLAFARFEGSRDQFDRSYMGQPKVVAGAVVPFFETAAAPAYGTNPIRKYLGLHAKQGDMVNTMYDEAYNIIYNFRAGNRSKNLALRTRLDNTLAPAFWPASRFAHVVPDFDQAVIDGEVALNVVNARLAVKGLAVKSTYNASVAALANLRETGGTGTVTYPYGEWTGSADPNGIMMKVTAATGAAGGYPDVWAEMQDNGITVSLSNIELAKKTQAFAKLREQYQGVPDSWIIDMLMGGLSIPDQYLKQPILVADRTVRFSQVKRYATDAANLASSAVSGGAMLDLELHVPQLSTGGIVMVIAEAVPEQLFERQRDPFLYADAVADLPEYLRDTLDPEKVDVILNGEIDTEHATAANTFGYAPMNWRWNAFGPRVGGKFLRPQTDPATDTARTRLWAVEKVNPSLSADFYIVSNMHVKPFLDTATDPFELTATGGAVIEGNTVFGPQLIEPDTPTSNYDAVLAKAPQTRIVKP